MSVHLLLSGGTSFSLPSWIDEPHHVVVERTVDGIYDSKFSERLHGEQQHETDDLRRNIVLASHSHRTMGLAVARRENSA
jgi:hypothetical protein